MGTFGVAEFGKVEFGECENFTLILCGCGLDENFFFQEDVGNLT